MTQALSTCPESSVIWANQVLITAAAIYVYDFILTFRREFGLWRDDPRRLLRFLVPLRYPMLFLQIFVLFATSWTRVTPRTCKIRDNIGLSFDTIFQVSYVVVLTRRVHYVANKKWFITLPLGLLGFVAPIVNVAVPNPSIFPDCRLLDSSPPSRIVTLLPIVRAIFDAAATMAFLVELRRHQKRMKMVTSTHGLVYELMREALQDLMMIFSIMAMEAIFFQIPSARNHARNYIAPFVDSITAILAVKFILAAPERGKSEESDTITLESVRVPSLFMRPRSTSPPLWIEPPSESDKEVLPSSSFQIDENQHSNYPPPFSPPQGTSMFNEQEDSQTSAIFSPPLEMPGAVHLRNPSVHNGGETASGRCDYYRKNLESSESPAIARPLTVIEKRRVASAVGRLAFGTAEEGGLAPSNLGLVGN